MIDNYYDQIFISDIHLSTWACNDKDIRDLWANFYSPTLYLVGDCVDLWRLKTIELWPPSHTDVIIDFIQLLNDKIDIKYIVGNHDEFLKNFIGNFSNLSFMNEDIIEINGKKLLVTHGHKFDFSIRYFKWFGVWLTGIYDLIKRRENKSFSMNEYLERNKNKTNKFENIAMEYIKKKGLDGIICGHTHKPNLFIKNNLIYANTGDFVTNSSFITQKNNCLTLWAYNHGVSSKIQSIKL